VEPRVTVPRTSDARHKSATEHAPTVNGRTKSGPYYRLRTPAWSHGFNERGAVDLRSTRDLFSRRMAREWLRGLLRNVVLIAGDIFACLVAAYVALFVVDGFAHAQLYLVPRLIAFVVFGQAAAGTYRPGRSHGDYSQVIKGAIAASAARLVVDSLYDVTGLSTQAHLELAVLVVAALCAWRFALARLVRFAYSRSMGQKRTLIVAEQDRAFEVLERFRTADEPRMRHMGHIVPDADEDPTALGSIEDLSRFIEELDISYVIVAAELPREKFERVVHACFVHGAAVSVVPGTLAELPVRVSSRDILGWPLLELQTPRLHVLQVAIKRVLDILLSSVLIVLLAPLFGLIALAIRVESRGPIIFRQRRPGLGGKRFSMLKFRTMRPDAEALLHNDPALLEKFLANDCKLSPEEDPRISRTGALLRRTSLDELPQLFNVLRGDMSLIGPRPVVGPELDHYGDWVSTVLGVRPGMTGYWQVAGRSKIMYPERARLDIYYVTRWSLGLDLKILFMTVPAVFRRSGAH
jgi:exopolysaccharide biosynthesis polyprenyl glycosylphosphotransferase